MAESVSQGLSARYASTAASELRERLGNALLVHKRPIARRANTENDQSPSFRQAKKCGELANRTIELQPLNQDYPAINVNYRWQASV